MRILMLTHVVPAPSGGGARMKTWNVLRYLSRRHEVTLASFVRPHERSLVDAAGGLCEATLPVPFDRPYWREPVAAVLSAASQLPWVIARDERRAMRRLARSIPASRFDVVHADQLTMCRYALEVPAPRRVYDAHDAVSRILEGAARSAGPMRRLLALEALRLRRYEAEMCRAFDVVTTVTAEDADVLRQSSNGSTPVHIVPCSIDAESVQVRRAAPTEPNVLHVGTMHWPPNVDGVEWFLDRIWPEITRRIPQATFTCVGPGPPARLRRRAANGANVTVTGYVENVTPMYESSAVCVVPLRMGAGMRVKILEAFARGIPVVSTSLGCEGFQAEPGRHLLVADEPEAFADHVVRLLEDGATAAALARDARALVATTYDWRVALTALDAVYSPT